MKGIVSSNNCFVGGLSMARAVKDQGGRRARSASPSIDTAELGCRKALDPKRPI